MNEQEELRNRLHHDLGERIRPHVGGDLVPTCNQDEPHPCPSWDGKRCRALGFRPQTICEPAVIRLAEIVVRG